MFVKELNQPDASCYYFRIISKRVAVNVRIQGAKESRVQVRYKKEPGMKSLAQGILLVFVL